MGGITKVVKIPAVNLNSGNWLISEICRTSINFFSLQPNTTVVNNYFADDIENTQILAIGMKSLSNSIYAEVLVLIKEYKVQNLFQRTG